MKQGRYVSPWAIAVMVLASTLGPLGCSPEEKPPEAVVAAPATAAPATSAPTPTTTTPPVDRNASGQQVKNIKNPSLRPRQ